MIESTLTSLGLSLAERSGISLKKIIFHDKDSVFSFLKDNKLPIEFPAISYYCSEITESTEIRTIRNIKGNYNSNFTTLENIKVVPVVLSISLTLMANKMSDYFDFINFYHSLSNTNPFFLVNFKSEEIKGNHTVEMIEFSSLSTPARGLEGRDYDRGKYYVLEGSFSVNTYIAYIEINKVIRRISFTDSIIPFEMRKNE